LVLLAIVSLFAVAIGITSYLTFRRTLVQEGMATTSLAAESATKMMKDRISRQQEQAAAFLESVELNCALSGVLDRSCARDLLSKYRQSTGATGVLLNYRHSRVITAGMPPERSTQDPYFAFAHDRRHYILTARDPESASQIRTLYYDGTLIDLLPHFGPRSSGAMFLLDPSGLPVTLGKPWIESAFDYEHLAALCRQKSRGETTISDSAGRPAVIAFRTLPAMNGSCLLAELHLEDVVSPARHLRRKILYITLAFLGLAFFLSLAMGRLLSQPLDRLSRQITSLRKKGLQQQVISVESGPVEVKQLADDFASTMEQLRAAQEALRISEASLRERERLEAAASMASLLAHEINNPLAAMTNTVYLLRYGGPASDRQQLLEILSSDLDRVTHIVRQILSLYRPNPRPQAIDFQQLVHSVLDEMKSDFTAKNVQLITDIRPLPALAGFSSELTAAVANLLLNALQNVPVGGRVWVKANPVNYLYGYRSAVRILIGNEGSGLPQQERQRLFQAFTSSQGQGRGLGLWVAQVVIRKHEGEIRIRSGSGGKGTFVQVVLPARSYLQARVS
jgi:signal transduction histidine kinase